MARHAGAVQTRKATRRGSRPGLARPAGSLQTQGRPRKQGGEGGGGVTHPGQVASPDAMLGHQRPLQNLSGLLCSWEAFGQSPGGVSRVRRDHAHGTARPHNSAALHQQPSLAPARAVLPVRDAPLGLGRSRSGGHGADVDVHHRVAQQQALQRPQRERRRRHGRRRPALLRRRLRGAGRRRAPPQVAELVVDGQDALGRPPRRRGRLPVRALRRLRVGLRRGLRHKQP